MRLILQGTLRAGIALLAVLVLTPQTLAQGLIRDAEIERTLKGITDPVLRAAGLSPAQVDLSFAISKA